MTKPLPIDEPARERIRTDLETSLLVEAGAGSGKTSMLVDRMLQLLSTGTVDVEGMAAVTFTRKAAGELRQRLQQGLEKTLEELPPASDEAVRLQAALDALDNAFAGTIHSFCARLLRERPLEAGVDPGFRELMTAEFMQMARRFWSGFLDRRAADGDPLLEEMERAGLRPARFTDLFFKMMDNLDVEFPTPDADPPDPFLVTRIRRRLEELLDLGLGNLPETEPADGWDRGMSILRELRFSRRFPGWDETTHFMDALALVCGRKSFDLTQKRWTSPVAAKLFKAEMNAFIDPEGPAAQLLLRWYAYRYPLVIRFVRQAAEEFREMRLRNGTLSFQDLLEGAAALLRGHPEARRDLGERFRRLLVDEFQDTDPLQAEVLFLLACEPPHESRDGSRDGSPDASADGPGQDGGGEGEGGEGEGSVPVAGGAATASPGDEEAAPAWARGTPRPGALFVVGDPKQSIYRFRRADIALYGYVKDRFREFGSVVTLTTNFRSTPGIAALVNGVFQQEDRFPAVETPAQASFAPLDPWQPDGGLGPRVYRVEGSNREDVHTDDAARIASWVQARVEEGRKPGDFLILTRARRNLAGYAQALEARNLPVQVTGAGVGVEEELRELVLLLRALADPGDGVLTVAALTGLFVGLDHDELLDFRMAGGSFDVRMTHAEDGPGAATAAALNRLHTKWRRSRVEPADVFVASLAGEVGLIPWAAAGPLGSLRAGAMAYALDAVRLAATAGETSLPAALEALEAALEVEEAETPLEPLRGDAVRLMNLHQAKGLEASVVILAEPAGAWSPPVQVFVERVGARAVGWFSVEEKGDGPYARAVVVARPRVWAEKVGEAERFDAAEDVRLLYVAATRARETLLVAHNPGSPAKSPWQVLAEWLQENQRTLTLEATPEPPRTELEVDPAELSAQVSRSASILEERARSSYRIAPVTMLAKGEEVRSGGQGVKRSPHPVAVPEASRAPTSPAPPADPGVPRGTEWGSVVHAALALATRGLSSDGLQRACSTLLQEHERPLAPDGTPAELPELLATIEGVRGSGLWKRAMASSRRLVEAPFALPGFLLRDLELPGDQPHSAGELPDVLEGVVDLAFQEPDGWVIADYKTDLGDSLTAPTRREGYRRQVDLYAACWERLTGERVKEKILLFTRSGTEVRW